MKDEIRKEAEAYEARRRVEELTKLPINWDFYKGMDITPEKLVASGVAIEFAEGRKVRVATRPVLPDGTKVGAVSYQVAQLRKGKDDSQLIYLDPRKFSKEDDLRVYYGFKADKDAYHTITPEIKGRLLAGEIVLLEKEGKPETAVLAEWNSKIDTLETRECSMIYKNIKESKNKLSEAMTDEQKQDYSRGESVTPKGWKTAIQFSPASGGFVKSEERAQTLAESKAKEESHEQAVQNKPSRGRG